MRICVMALPLSAFFVLFVSFVVPGLGISRAHARSGIAASASAAR